MSTPACLVGKTPVKVFKNGVKMWNLDDALNGNKSPVNLSDKPVEILKDGTKMWNLDDILYSDDENIIVQHSDGSKDWYENGKKHRLDGPAHEGANGTKTWFKHGQLHREDGPAIERYDGYKAWYKNNKCHREDGPAIEMPNGNKEWWENGERLRREEAPADNCEAEISNEVKQN